MGGDGGVIASNRRYMRGAGTADHTGDNNNSSKNQQSQQDDQDALLERMTTCAITKAQLLTSSLSQNKPIVADAYGRLYHKEAAIEALLLQKQQRRHENDNTIVDNNNNVFGSSGVVRGMKDLFDVRFHTSTTSNMIIPICPITGTQLNGQIPAILLVQLPNSNNKKKKNKNDKSDRQQQNLNQPNVLSLRAMKELDEESIQYEYGPYNYQIRLAPTQIILEQMKQQWEEKQIILQNQLHKNKNKKKDKDKNKKKKNSKDDNNKKRKHNNNTNTDDNGKDDEEKKEEEHHNNNNKKKKTKSIIITTTTTSIVTTNKKNNTVAESVRQRVASAVQKNEVLSSIFTTKK